MRRGLTGLSLATLCASVLPFTCGYAADGRSVAVEKVVARAIQPLMQRYGIPGMAVGVVLDGQSYSFAYGVASIATGKPVTSDTLFELGSVSKVFTATLASYAQVGGFLALSDAVSKDLPALRGSSFDTVSLLDLGTHTSGGLPLQVPDDVASDDQLMSYLRAWKPTYAPGTYRTYANPSIGLLGMIAARTMNESFDVLMERRLFPALGMNHAYLDVPRDEVEHYAQGYTKTGAPIRMAPGVLASEAYGIRTTVPDMVHFIEANMQMVSLDKDLQRAIVDTHTGYFQVGPMTQDLIWEQYPYPVALKDLLAGNSATMSYEANAATRLDPPLRPQDDVLLDKTGSTNGFASYVAFVPKKRFGIVMLANKNYPIEARVTAAFGLLSEFKDGAPGD